MKIICQDCDVVDYFQGNNSLLDARIDKISICSVDSKARVNIYLNMRSTSEHRTIMLSFFDNCEFFFAYSAEQIFYNIERYKLLVTNNNQYYLSCDPYDEFSTVVSDEDNDIIKANHVTAFLISD